MKHGALLLTSVVLAACAPDLPLDDGLVTTPRILAVKGEPAEAKPGVSVEYTVLVADPRNSDAGATIVWDFCTAPKPPTENNAVSTACLDASSLVSAGAGPSITAATPADACSLFGPDTPPGGFRPRDPDVTGGYYQPLRADLAGAPPAFHLQRILCELGMAPPALVTEFAMSYVPNENPELLPLTFTVGGSTVTPSAIPLGARVTLVASWPEPDAETYVYFDRDSQALTTKREAMSVAWYVTAGELEVPATGRGEGDSLASTSNVWTAPGAPGTSTLWVVLRDSRGGVDFAEYELDVTP
jgi:hypothetical protein